MIRTAPARSRRPSPSPRPAATADRPLRALLDYRPALFGRGGIRTYVRDLVRAYAAAFPGDTLLLWSRRLRGRSAAPPDAAPPGTRLLAGPLPSPLSTFLTRLGAGPDRLAGGADLVHWTDYVPLRAPGIPLVATVHDLLFESLPDCYTASMRRGLRAVTRRIAREASRVVVPSARTRDALVAFYGVPADRIDVVPHGAPTPLDVPPAREHGRYLLSVGTLEPRKNLARVLEAWRVAVRRCGPVRLVVAGPRGWRDEALAADLAASPAVVWEGNVGPERLAALYRGAVALAYPSLGEGFGLPVLEAMAYGCPVLVGADTACSDLAGEAALSADPREVLALADALERLLEDPLLRARLAAAGLARAREYTWEAAARATRAAWVRALGSGPGPG